MLLIAVLCGLLGLFSLLLPRRFLLFGSRWQLRDGGRAEASDTYVVVTRLAGLVFLLAAAGLTFVHFASQSQAETRESLSTAWDVYAYSDEPLRIIDDPEVERVSDVERSVGALTGARTGLPTWSTAVVGRDEVGNLGVSVKDGDLWLAAVAGTCTPGALMVSETDESVTVAMTAISTPFGDGEFIPCYPSRYEKPAISEILIVRVPLEKPLGDREVLTVRAPGREDFGAPRPPIPGTTATPSPSP